METIDEAEARRIAGELVALGTVQVGDRYLDRNDGQYIDTVARITRTYPVRHYDGSLGVALYRADGRVLAWGHTATLVRVA